MPYTVNIIKTQAKVLYDLGHTIKSKSIGAPQSCWKEWTRGNDGLCFEQAVLAKYYDDDLILFTTERIGMSTTIKG